AWWFGSAMVMTNGSTGQVRLDVDVGMGVSIDIWICACVYVLCIPRPTLVPLTLYHVNLKFKAQHPDHNFSHPQSCPLPKPWRTTIPSFSTVNTQRSPVKENDTGAGAEVPDCSQTWLFGNAMVMTNGSRSGMGVSIDIWVCACVYVLYIPRPTVVPLTLYHVNLKFEAQHPDHNLPQPQSCPQPEPWRTAIPSFSTVNTQHSPVKEDDTGAGVASLTYSLKRSLSASAPTCSRGQRLVVVVLDEKDKPPGTIASRRVLRCTKN
ncbi:hypothetical protein H0H92_009364, partial [Tricholoma furcatifolium]